MIFTDFASYKASGFSPTVCIVGSGPAGISIALQLEKQKIPCLIIEAGGFEYDEKVNDAYRGNVYGDKYLALEFARLRYFGGSSGHWGGWCRPLDDVDFEMRNGIKNSGWPISKKDLDPYHKMANSIFEIDEFPPSKPLNENLSEIHFEFSPPVRFGNKYRKHIENSPLIGLLINSPIMDIVPTGKKISHINLYSKNGESKQISAKYYCLCTGGIENSRLLLWSNQLHHGGVVPEAQTLGKYWMEHPIYVTGDTVLYTFTKMRAKKNRGLNVPSMRYYAPTTSFLRTHGIGNFSVRVITGDNLVQALIKDGLCVAPSFFTSIAQKVNEGLVCSAEIKLAWEQVPISENRIELGTEKDALGMPRVNLFWKKQPQDRLTAEIAMKLFGSYLIKENLGRVKLISWLANKLDYPEHDERVTYHHMGGTRMASTPADGIVDANCKVFGIDNLYIGGSSVFPTGGHCNPTYTIVQLALRLGEHLGKQITQTA